ncbi:MAG: hypothetical protein HQK53_06015 [Oligoflexia bacterium]|nr:hypothetical protein [Oligoflexia bacterium]
MNTAKFRCLLLLPLLLGIPQFSYATRNKRHCHTDYRQQQHRHNGLGMKSYGDYTYYGLWGKGNNPVVFSSSGYYELELDKLPLAAALPQIPWSGDYWPFNRGGPAYRWQIQESVFKYQLLSKKKIKRLSLDKIAKLSPAEKYDIFMGRFDYPLTNYLRKISAPDDEMWEGICNGWSSASMHFSEPGPVVLKPSRGDRDLLIPFASADIKALLSFAEANIDSKCISCGLRCDLPLKKEDAHDGEKEEELARNACSKRAQDINPGAFHLILANEIGIKKRSFVSEIDAGVMVWNQPTYRYHATKIAERPADDLNDGVTVNIVSFNTTVEYTDESDPSWGKCTSSDCLKEDNYTYDLYLDRFGRIMGGKWTGESVLNHPDFVWRTEKPKIHTSLELAVDEDDSDSETFEIDFSGIEKIYQASIKAEQNRDEE